MSAPQLAREYYTEEELVGGDLYLYLNLKVLAQHLITNLMASKIHIILNSILDVDQSYRCILICLSMFCAL